MNRRDFINRVFVAVVVLPMITKQTAKAWMVEAVVAMVVLAIGAIIICKLLGLCRRLNQPRKPDKDDGASAPTTPPGIKPAVVPLDSTIDQSYFGTIDDQSDDFKTPSGTFYTAMMAALVQSSTDLINWTPAGSFTAWFADDYAVVTQIGADGTKNISTIPNWKATGIPAMMIGYGTAQSQQFFRTSPNL